MLNKLYNKHLDIITQNDNVIHIERKKILIHESPILYGEASIIRKNNSVYLIKEVYSFEDNRLRYSYDVYDNVKAYDTVEKKRRW